MKQKVIRFVVKSAISLAVSALIGALIKSEKQIEDAIDAYWPIKPITPTPTDV